MEWTKSIPELGGRQILMPPYPRGKYPKKVSVYCCGGWVHTRIEHTTDDEGETRAFYVGTCPKCRTDWWDEKELKRKVKLPSVVEPDAMVPCPFDP